MTIALVNSEKALNGLVKSAINATGKASVLIHQAAFNALAHANNTGDIRPLQALITGLPKRASVAVGVWASAHGKVSVQKDGTVKHSGKKTPDMAKAELVAPLDYLKEAKPRAPKAFDLKAEMEKLLKRANDNNASGKPLQLLEQAIKAA